MPAVKGMSGADSSFLLGTFNKILFPSLRLGYMVVPDRWIDPILNLRYRTDRYPPSLTQQILADVIDQGHFTRHLRRMRRFMGSATYARRFCGAVSCRRSPDPNDLRGTEHSAYLVNKISSRTASSLARDNGVEAWPIDRYTIKRRDFRALILGFAAFKRKEIKARVVSLARALCGYRLDCRLDRARPGHASP
jgi:GntR family transcriptional regulator / MocR family aminotransferase